MCARDRGPVSAVQHDKESWIVEVQLHLIARTYKYSLLRRRSTVSIGSRPHPILPQVKTVYPQDLLRGPTF